MSKQSLNVRSFAALVRAHAVAIRRFNAQLAADHDLTIRDFEVLLRLAWAPDRRMRRVDLTQQVLLSASGVTRLLDGLERCGLVERAACETDRRVVYAVLTDAGAARLQEAAASHFAEVDEVFGELYDEGECGTLLELLSRLGGDDSEPDPGDGAADA